MNNLDHKINLFTQSVFADAQRQRDAILEEIESVRKEELSSAELALLEENYHIIQEEMTNIRSRYKQQISKEVVEYRRQLLAKREGVIQEVFTHVRQRLERFTKGPEYPEYLIRVIDGAGQSFQKPALTVSLRPQDQPLIPQLQSALPQYDLTFVADPAIELGGATIKATDSNLLSDETFDFRLACKREDFVKESGLAVENL